MVVPTVHDHEAMQGYSGSGIDDWRRLRNLVSVFTFLALVPKWGSLTRAVRPPISLIGW